MSPDNEVAEAMRKLHVGLIRLTLSWRRDYLTAEQRAALQQKLVMLGEN